MIVQGLPHACGGVSHVPDQAVPYIVSSPRMWGCFPMGMGKTEAALVFPTHVGVFLRAKHPERPA